jgi:ribonuclease E
VADDKKPETASVADSQTAETAPMAEVEKTEIKPISESNEPKEPAPAGEPTAPASTFGHVFIAPEAKPEVVPEAKPEVTPEPEATHSPEATGTQSESVIEEPAQSEPSEAAAADQATDKIPAPEAEDKMEKSVFAPPVTPRHTGRVMDVVPPSSMSAAAMSTRPASAAARTNTVVADPMVNPVRAPRMDMSGGHESVSSNTPVETAAPTLDTTDLANAISQSLSSTEQPADTSSFAEAASEQSATSSLASPFVNNASATIEKRPLGSYGTSNGSDENSEVSMVSPDLMGAEATDDAQPAPEKNDLGGKPRLSLEPSSEVAAEESVGMNSDLDRELMALEMGIKSELADGDADASEEEQTPEVAATVAELDSLTNESSTAETDMPEKSAVENDQPAADVDSESASQSTPMFDQQAAVAMNANEPVETSTPEPAPMFEAAAAQPQPIEEKKPSGVMSFIIILILLLLGAGGGAAAYYFLLVQ